jgi:hypothetical protein
MPLTAGRRWKNRCHGPSNPPLAGRVPHRAAAWTSTIEPRMKPYAACVPLYRNAQPVACPC